MRFTPVASSGLTERRRFKGVTLGEPGGPDPQAGDQPVSWVSHEKLGWRLSGAGLAISNTPRHPSMKSI